VPAILAKAGKLISTHTFYISSPTWVKLSTGDLHVMSVCNQLHKDWRSESHIYFKRMSNYFGTGKLYQNVPSEHNFCKNQQSESHVQLRGINGFLLAAFTFIVPFG
jgi:hypothetical protein